MAKKRMLSLEVIDTDSFMEMHHEAQWLYMHLNLRTDDDGFISNANRLMKMLNAKEKYFKELVDKGFIIQFKTGPCVIRHWLISNNLHTNNRYKPTGFSEEFAQLSIVNSVYERVITVSCQSDVKTVSEQCLNGCQPNITEHNLTEQSVSEQNINKQKITEQNVADSKSAEEEKKKSFGRHNMVYLTDEEYMKLHHMNYEGYLFHLDELIYQNGDTYPSHYDEILAIPEKLSKQKH